MKTEAFNNWVSANYSTEVAKTVREKIFAGEDPMSSLRQALADRAPREIARNHVYLGLASNSSQRIDEHSEQEQITEAKALINLAHAASNSNPFRRFE